MPKFTLYIILLVFSISGLASMTYGQVNVDSLRYVLEHTDSDSVRVDALLELSIFYSRVDTQQAHLYLEQVLEIATANKNEFALINYFNRKGNLAQNAGAYDESITYYRQGIAATNDSIQIARLLGGVGASKYFQGDFDSAAYFMLKGYQIKLVHDAEDTVALATSLLNLATVVERSNDIKKVLEYELTAKDMFESIGDEAKLATLYNNIGTTYRKLGDDLNRLKYLQKSYDFAISIPDYRTVGNSSINLGHYYWEKKDFERSLSYYKEAVNATRKIGQRFDLANALQNLGENYAILDSMPEAKACLKESLSLANQLDATEFRINVLNTLAKMAMDTREDAAAVQYLTQAVAEAKDYEYLQTKKATFGQAIRFYHQMGMSERSMDLFDLYVTVNDSLAAGRQNEIVKDLQIRYETKEKDAQLAMVSLQAQKANTQRNLYSILLISAVVLFFLMVYIFQSRKNLQVNRLALQEEKIQNLEKYQKIVMMDSILQGQEEERKRIAQDLHDGLGTLLAAVRMQMQSIQREVDKLGELKLIGKTEELVDHACQEVRRISHDMMPSTLIDLGLIASIEDLVNDLKYQQSLLFKLDLPQEQIDLSNVAAINIYRIIQEVLQNILKHSNASIVELGVRKSEREIHIYIADDGRGFDLSQNNFGLGLQNIKSRTNYLNGDFEIKTKPGEGCSYKFRIPLLLVG